MIHPIRHHFISMLFAASLLWQSSPTVAQPDGNPAGVTVALPTDYRTGPPRTLNDYFPMAVPSSADEWAARSDELRRRVLIATGLYPMPTLAPLRPIVHSPVQRPGYSVHRVILESLPGHYVTGSLYVPDDLPAGGKAPAVLSPHGHWADGRFHDHGAEEVRREIASGGERFETSGRHPLQARCVQLARMGCIVFHYDMVGYADSVQLPHRFGPRAEMSGASEWGFASAEAESRLVNSMGLQTINSVRALDFIASLPNVDTARIAVTGASGGGTQTFILAAIDPRPAALFPAVMVSTGMQGGCTCENAPYLRIDAGNVDLAALAAPRPLGMTTADDWTVELMSKGLPDLRSLYETLGTAGGVEATSLNHFGHNYNAVSRVAMYNFINKHFGLGLAEPVIEKDFEPLSRQEMSVWTADHPTPASDGASQQVHERAIAHYWAEDVRRQIEAARPRDAASLAAYRHFVGHAWRTILNRTQEQAGQPTFTVLQRHEAAGAYISRGVITTRPTTPHIGTPLTENVDALFIQSKRNATGQTLVYLTDAGTAALLDEKNEPAAAIRPYLDAGRTVVAIDWLPGDNGRNRTWHQPDGSQPWHNNPAYTYGYNQPLFTQRTHDILTVIHYIHVNGPPLLTIADHDAVIDDAIAAPPLKDVTIDLIAIGPQAGPLGAAARFVAGPAVRKAAIDTGGFSFDSVTDTADAMFVPGAVRYDGVAALLALSAPNPLDLITPIDEYALALVRNAYRAANAAENLNTPLR